MTHPMKSLLADIWTVLVTGLRVATFQRVPNLVPVAPATPVVMVMLAIAAIAAMEWVVTADASFEPSGLSFAIGGWAIVVAGLMLARRDRRPIDIAAIVATLAAAISWLCIPFWALGALVISINPETVGMTAYFAIAGISIIAFVLWPAIAYWRVGRVATRGMPVRLGLWMPALSILPMLLLPYQPVYTGYSSGSAPIPTVWQIAAWLTPAQPAAGDSAPRPPSIDVEAAFDQQSSLVERSLAELAPSRPGVGEVYFVGAATYSGQDVFKREVSSARQIVEERFGSAGRSVLLINHRETLSHLPLATATNLEKVLAGVGRVMDPDKDLLVLFVTSHGNKGSISVSFPRFGLNDLTPERLAKMLEKSGIKHRVVILSACHAGSFIAALEHPGNLVMAAAHADKTSFGCSNEREWTYFGDALFNHGMRKTNSLPAAFEIARETVQGWEKAQGLTPSEPQIFTGADIARRLKAMDDRSDSIVKAEGAPAAGPNSVAEN